MRVYTLVAHHAAHTYTPVPERANILKTSRSRAETCLYIYIYKIYTCAEERKDHKRVGFSLRGGAVKAGAAVSKRESTRVRRGCRRGICNHRRPSWNPARVVWLLPFARLYTWEPPSTPLLLSLPRSLFFLRRVGCRVRLLEHGVASPRSRGGSIRIRFDRLFPSIVKWRKWNNGDVKTNICIYICVMGNLECVYSLIKELNKLISLYLCTRLFEREKCKLIRCFFEYYLIFFRFSEKRI